MHIAIAVGTLLLSGVVLNSPSEDEQAGLQPLPGETTTQGQAAPSGQQRRPAMGTPEGGAARGGMGMSGGAQPRMQQRQPMMMPSAPTDMSGPMGSGASGQPMAPTSNSPLMDGSRGGSRYGPRSISAPTERRPGAGMMGSAFAPTSFGAGDQTKRVDLQRSNSAIMAPSLSEKAFANYKPTSGVSPYMNLFRRDSLGTVDNYTTLVRPELDQRAVNQQYGRDIRGLERNTRMQGSTLQQLNRDTRTLQGVGTPQFYQNYGNYYQGFGQ